MDEMMFPLLAIAVICGSIVIGALAGFALYLRNQRLIEDRKNERIIAVEQEKTAREERKAELQGLELRRDLVGMKLDSDIINGGSKTDEEEGGLGGIINTVLPMLMQNPALLQSLLGKPSENTNGGESGATAPNFQHLAGQPSQN